MSVQSSNQIMNVVPGLIAILAVLGLAYYFCVAMVSIEGAVATETPKESYPITSVENELKSGVFSKLPAIETKTGGVETQPEAIRYQDDELGKDDLTKLE